MPKYLPRHKTNSMAWARAIAKSMCAFLRRHPDNDLLAFTIENMLVPDHTFRRDVWECLDGALWSKSVAETECSGSPNEAGSLSDPDGLDDGDESEPSTPKALQSVDQQHLANSNGSIIRALIGSLGTGGDRAVNALIGTIPSSLSSFQRRVVDKPRAEYGDGANSVPVPAVSMIESDLWNWPALEEGAVVEDKKDEDEAEEEEEEEEEESGCAEQAEGEKSQPSFEARLYLLLEVTALTTETRAATQYKRRFWDSNDEKNEATDEEPVVYEVDRADIFGPAVVARLYKKARW